MTEADEIRHDVPFPWGLRLILCSIGVFFAFIAPYELWRGLWPLNVATPFFAIFIIAAWSGAYVVLTIGLCTPEKLYVFRRGALDVTENVLSRIRQSHYTVQDIAWIESVMVPDSDGPDRFLVRISLKNGELHQSRIFDTAATARKHADDFKRVLGI